jgi:hypothetical protein
VPLAAFELSRLRPRHAGRLMARPTAPV